MLSHYMPPPGALRARVRLRVCIALSACSIAHRVPNPACRAHKKNLSSHPDAPAPQITGSYRWLVHSLILAGVKFAEADAGQERKDVGLQDSDQSSMP